MNITQLEAKVLKEVWSASFDYSTDAKEIAEKTGMDIKSVKGALGSLVKKGLAYSETDERGGVVFHDIFPVFNGKVICFDGENLSNDEWHDMNNYRNNVLTAAQA